jgi:Family of unknown function (DUF6069)
MTSSTRTTSIADSRANVQLIPRHSILRVGVLASVAAAAATAVVALAAEAADVPMRAGSLGAHHADAIGPLTFALTTLMWSAVGTLLAAILARRAARSARTFQAVTVALTGLSLLGPVLAGATALATRLTLGTAHLVAAAIVIPALTWRLETVVTTRRQV